MTIVPMRAADLKGSLAGVRYPVIASPKLDGYRATVQRHVETIGVYSKNNKLIPNEFVQNELSFPGYVGLDGELIVGNPTAPGSLQATSSGVTRRAGAPDFVFWVFDLPGCGLDRPFNVRLQVLTAKFAHGHLRVKLVPHKIIASEAELEAYEAWCVEQGYEGVMLRDPFGIYKQGGLEPRSTVAELYVAKLKRVEDFEAVVEGSYEQMENANAATKDELGRTKRSTAKAGKVAKGVLGGLQVRGINGRWTGVAFDVGTGFTDAQRAELWAQRHALIGRIVKVTSGRTPATFVKPQFPRFKDFKWKGDL